MAIWAKYFLTKKGASNRNFSLNLSLKISKIQKAEVAQSVEQGTENPRVGSSILSLGTRNHQLDQGIRGSGFNPFFF
jgi:hypothetical protein